MVVWSLDPKNDPFHPKEDDKKILGPKIPYLNAIGALLYLAQYKKPDIAFVVNLLVRFSSTPTSRHWNEIKHVFRYLSGTKDLELFYPKKSVNDPKLVGYIDVGYLSDPHKACSQARYVFTHNGTTISWRFTKQTLVATSSNHSEILALHEASQECVWLGSVIHHIEGFVPPGFLDKVFNEAV
ncbi:secreted RxLR effector protein 161-like [Pistacia vera]|uniref:secreted RxLR effector protein 161-like n=1 Tax=Pistacia vera TaxID=55513 RepID=UPI001262B0DC|nr:secreted RxLR effector protein 161-like [Pistacia vera]